MAETIEPADTNASRALWRRLRWVYVAIIGVDVVAGLVTGLLTDSSLFFAILLVLFIVIVTWVGFVVHVSIGWCTAVPRRSVAIEAILAGLFAAVVGGGASLSAFDKTYVGRVDRTKALGDAVIEDVRAYKVTHSHWPANPADAGVDPARLASGPLALRWEVLQDANGERVPSIRFARPPGFFGMTYRTADQDTWTVSGD